MGIDMYLEQSQAQADSVTSHCQVQLEGYQQLQTAIQAFANDIDSLQGKAYDSARDYFSSVLLPLAKGGELYGEALSTAISKLPTDYQDMVDTKSWREDDLLQKIEQEDSLIAQLSEINESISKASLSTETNRQLKRDNVELIRSHYANKRVYETILKDLRAYDSYSAGLFDELETIETQMSTGISQLGNSWDAATGTFKTLDNMTWATSLSAYHATKDLKVSQEDKVYIENLMIQYGFDVQTAQQILDVRNGIAEKFPDLSQKERDYLLLRLLGGASYNDAQWNETAGQLTPYFYIEVYRARNRGQVERVAKPLLEIFEELGLTKDQAKQLNYNLRLQHEMASGETGNVEKMKARGLYEAARGKYKEAYGSAEGFDAFWDRKLKAYSNNGKGHADFTHQSITMATHLNPTGFQLSDFYGGRENVKDLSGWEGDTTYNANDRKPSIGEDDYKADLDSVNIIGRMEKGQSYEAAMASYYEDVKQDVSVREKEFLQNENWETVKETVYEGLVPLPVLELGEDAAKEYIAKNYEDVSRFLERLEAVAE